MTIDKNLKVRTTETRETKEVYLCFSFHDIIDDFNRTVADVDENLNYYDEIKNEKQKSELLRYQVILLESAFDYLCHCLIKYGFVKIFRNEWEKTLKYDNFQVKFSQLSDAIIAGVDEDWILKMVDSKIASQTFLGYNDFKDGINYIDNNLIDEVACKIYRSDKHTSMQKLKDDFDKIYKRRNMIAHQNDRDHKDGKKNSIDKDVVLECKKILTNVVNTIAELITEKNK